MDWLEIPAELSPRSELRCTETLSYRLNACHDAAMSDQSSLEILKLQPAHAKKVGDARARIYNVM